MNEEKRDYFFAENEYKCYVIGCFKELDFVPHMLEEYGGLCIDSPKLDTYYNVGDWTIIPCPVDIIDRCEFLNLMSWLNQGGEEAFAVALHKDKSYFAKVDVLNPFGDTALIVFEEGTVVIWDLPGGFVEEVYCEDEMANLGWIKGLSEYSCKSFLTFIGANELVEYLNL